MECICVTSLTGEPLVTEDNAVAILIGSLTLAAGSLLAVPWCFSLPLLIFTTTASGVALGAAKRGEPPTIGCTILNTTRRPESAPPRYEQIAHAHRLIMAMRLVG